MNVTLLSNLVKRWFRAARDGTFDNSPGRLLRLAAGGGNSRAETFTNLEAVDASGVSTWNGSFPIVLTGVI